MEVAVEEAEEEGEVEAVAVEAVEVEAAEEEAAEGDHLVVNPWHKPLHLLHLLITMVENW